MAEHLDTRPLYRRALGKSFWFTVNKFRRAASSAKQARRRIYFEARNTPGGRAMLKLSEIASSPRDRYHRRRVAASYIRHLPTTLIDRDNGYAILPPGSLKQVDDILPTCLRLFERKRANLDALADEESAYAALRKKRAFLRNLLSNEDLARNPELLDFALSDQLLGAVANYLGTIPHLNRIDLLYSVPRDSDDAVASQLYHLDPEGLSQAKLFLNINDVGLDQGPFTFIPAAESTRIIKAIKGRRRQKGGSDIGRYLDHEIAEVNGLDKAVSVMGPTGTAGIVDTSRCLHCGSRVKPGTFRLCLYIQYCTSREHGNVFDLKRYQNDPVRYLALENSRRSTNIVVTAPHQMS